MEEYNNFAEAINKIFEMTNIMKNRWDDQDNLARIESIESVKKDINEVATNLRSNS